MTEFDFTTFPILNTPRLVLRQITAGDAANLLSMNSDPEVLKYDVDPPMKDIPEALAEIEKYTKSFTDKQSIGWGVCLKEEDRLIGDFVFFFYNQAYYKADLGYRLAQPYWRQGYATEALCAIIQFAFETLNLHRINVDTRMENLASVRLMKKVGFTHEGVRRECVLNADGSYQSWGLYGLLEEEYRSLLGLGNFNQNPSFHC
jgi:[ribosomal protein S5]-alanine N-acetyltransferase